MKMSFLSILAICSSLLTGATRPALADDAVVDKVPENLASAEILDKQPSGETTTEEDFDAGRGGGHGGRGGWGRGWGGGRGWNRGRGGIHPVPHSFPNPGPVWWPRSYPHQFVCFAQSPANGQTYSAAAVVAGNAQSLALAICRGATGFECVARGCQ